MKTIIDTGFRLTPRFAGLAGMTVLDMIYRFVGWLPDAAIQTLIGCADTHESPPPTPSPTRLSSSQAIKGEG